MGWFGDVERGLGVGLEPCETLLLILKLAAGVSCAIPCVPSGE